MTQPTDRPGINHLTSDMLDQLYDRAELAEADRDGWRERAHGYRTRAEKAEATLTAVRAECDRIEAAVRSTPISTDLTGGYLACLRHIRAVLDQHGQTTV